LIPTDENNLVVKIARGFLRHFALDGGVRFYLYKRIPAGGGLGGASSNAAAALLLLNDLFATRQSWQELARFSEAYGSDIAYFLQSCAAICRGRGEVVEPIAAPNALCLVIVRPPFGLSTADVFQRLAQQRRDDSGGYSVARAHTETRQMAQCLREGRTREIAGSLSNDLQPAAIRLRPELTQVQQVMDRTYPLASQMSGSGSCWFACYPHRRRALWASHRLRASGIGTVDIARPISTPLPPTSPP
jgi:4-diphosphocytidyl-2-C-methyl-D-erythritol kinase